MNIFKSKRIANEILEELNEYNAPIDIDSIVKKYDIDVFVSDLSDNISGVFEPKENGGTIYVNANHSEKRNNFSVAHEFGHFVLGHCDSIHVDKIYRNQNSSLAISPKEIEANNFAAEILMPKRLVEKHINKLLSKGVNTIDKIVNELMTIFNVSKQAITIKLSSLGYNIPQ